MSTVDTMTMAEITYMGDLRTKAVHLKSGSVVITDAPLDNNGKGEAFSPTDLISAALGSCMLTIMGIVGNRHQISLEGTKVEISKIMAADPRRVGEIVVKINFPVNNFSEKEKQLLKNAAQTCPVALSLHPELKQTVQFNF